MQPPRQRPFLQACPYDAYPPCIAAQLDQPADAVSLLAQSFGQVVTYGHYPHTDPRLDPLRDYPPFRELMRPKG